MFLTLISKLLYCSTTQFCSIVISVFTAILGIVYYVFIQSVTDHYRLEQRNEVLLQDEILQINQQIADYPTMIDLQQHISHQQLSLADDAKLSIQQLTNQIAQQLSKYNLQLINFEYDDTQQWIMLNYRITGRYHEFIDFLQQLSTQSLNIVINTLSISPKSRSIVCDFQIKQLNINEVGL